MERPARGARTPIDALHCRTTLKSELATTSWSDRIQAGRIGGMGILSKLARHLVAASVLICGATSLAHTADYPTRPVKVIIPFAAGGPTDIVGRLITAKMREAGFEQPLVIENRGGGGGSIGTDAAARAEPDGYTLTIGTSSTHGTNPHLYEKLNYHPVDSFAAIAQIGVTPMMLVVNPKIPARNVAEFVAYAKANPGKLNQGSAGVGSIGHILGGLLNKEAGTDTTLVPYAGSGPASRDLIAGVIDFTIDGLPVVAPSARAGNLFLLATTMGKRAQAFPDVPTMAESGFPDFDGYTWNVFYAPAGTPKPVIDHIFKFISIALSDADVIARLQDVGVEPTPDTTPAKAAEFTRREYEKWRPLVKLSGAKVE
jgi:tripartite-type tricarboxylate transporter receptor subunit TctC